jgi:nucleoid-associated protein YgaU
MEIAPSPPANSISSPKMPSRNWASTGTTPLTKSGVPAASSRPEPPTPLNQRLANAALAPKAGTYVVQPNDSYWTISQRLYGTGGYFRALAQCNRNTVPDENDLRVGSQILAPEAADLEKAYPDLCPTLAHRKAAERRTALSSTPPAVSGGRVYIVQEGDNLFDIARHELGKPTRWPEIVNLNQQLLGSDLDQLNYLTPGMRLVLPNRLGETTPTVTGRPGSFYRR